MEMQDDVYLDGSKGSDPSLIDIIKNQLNKPWIFVLIGLAIGLALGLLYAWVINPVRYTDAAAVHLREDLREDYARMVIDSYTMMKVQDPVLAQSTAVKRLSELQSEALTEVKKVSANPGFENQADALYFEELLTEQGMQPVVDTGGDLAATVPAEATAVVAGSEQPAAGSLGNIFTKAIKTACISVVILGAVVGVFIFLRSRKSKSGPSAAMMAQEFSRNTQPTDYEAIGEDPPLAQWITTYMIGDDLFDESFSIDSLNGVFMGECGVGIAETIGVGDPKRVMAFEVWLFDKNDIQTVTKVVMSQHSFNDSITHERMAAKGEPILAQIGKETVLETATLQMVARVVDMEYGEGALPDNSYFNRVTLELAVWKK